MRVKNAAAGSMLLNLSNKSKRHSDVKINIFHVLTVLLSLVLCQERKYCKPVEQKNIEMTHPAAVSSLIYLIKCDLEKIFKTEMNQHVLNVSRSHTLII